MACTVKSSCPLQRKGDRMVDPQSEALRGRHLLIVEDEYMIAAELAHALQDRGANVIGPGGLG